MRRPRRAQRQKSDESSSSLEDTSPTPPRGRRVVESEDAAFKIDAAGIVGDGVQLPSFAVWKVMRRSIDNGARSAEAVIRALGGSVVGKIIPEIVSAFTIECCLAVCVNRDDVPDKATIRVLHARRWQMARLKCVGGARYARLPDGTNVELSSQSWWYHYEAMNEGAGASPATRVAKVVLTGKAPTDAVVQARKLKAMPEEEAITYLMKRLGGMKAVGNRMACLAVLAINAFQTSEELRTGQTIDRNNKGWCQNAAPRAHKITTALAARRLLTRAEMNTAHDIVSAHAGQLIHSKHLAEVLAFGCPKDALVEDDEDDEEEDGDFVAPDEQGTITDYPLTNDDWIEDLGATEFVLRIKSARFLNYTAYQLLKVLRDTHKDDLDSIMAEMKEMWPMLKDQDVHVGLGHMGSAATAVGQKVLVLWDCGFVPGTVHVCEHNYVFCVYDDGDKMPFERLHFPWHFVV